jgi:hypothetical protein
VKPPIDCSSALEILADAIARGHYPLSTLQRHRWLDPVRNRGEFADILGHAEHRCRAAADALSPLTARVCWASIQASSASDRVTCD